MRIWQLRVFSWVTASLVTAMWAMLGAGMAVVGVGGELTLLFAAFGAAVMAIVHPGSGPVWAAGTLLFLAGAAVYAVVMLALGLLTVAFYVMLIVLLLTLPARARAYRRRLAAGRAPAVPLAAPVPERRPGLTTVSARR